MVKKRQINNRGVTLVELVVALAILAMLMTAVIMMMSNNSVIYRKTKADINVQTTAQETYSALQDSIMQAKAIQIYGYLEPDDSATKTYVTYKKKSLIATGESAEPFDTLMTESGDTYTYKNLKPRIMTIYYSVKNSDDLNNKSCVVNYYFVRYKDGDDQKCDIYVTRDYDAGAGSTDSLWSATEVSKAGGWSPLSNAEPTRAQRKVFEPYLYTASLSSVVFNVDYMTQSIDMKLSFLDKGMKYETSGIVSVRNSYVMKDMRNRLAGEVTVTEETTGGDEE